jgi:large repetitive protein
MSNRYQTIKFCFYALLVFAPFGVKAQTNVTVVVKSPTCNGYSNGEATATVTGGKEPYSYSWSTGQGGQTLYAAAGSYKLTVTDADGKTTIKDVVITDVAPLVANATAMGGACSDDKSLMASATGGTAPFTYTWRNMTSGSTSTAAMLSNPAQGSYFLQVTDSKGCSANKFMAVEGSLNVTAKVTDVYCNGRGDGGIEVKVTGGTAPYTYQWDANAKNATTPLANSLSGGTYTVMVTDANGCKKTITSTVVEPTPIIPNVVITGQCSGKGAVTINPTGGIPPYKAIWTHGPTSFTLNDLPMGSYYVCVMDANGCPADTPVEISDTKAIALVLTKEDAACGGVNNGKIKADVTGGALGPYTYKWSNGGSLTSNTISGLAAGTYTLTLVDNAGCTETKSITVANKTTLAVTTTATNSLCGGTTGTASVATITGGIAPFTYNWSNNLTSKDVNNLAAGNYNVIVTDANGCQASQLVTVGTSGSNISATALVTDGKCNTTNGSVKLAATGGTAPYTYKYSGGTNQTGIFSNLVAGDYSFFITDANGCTFTQMSSVKNIGAVKAGFEPAVNTTTACNADNLLYKFTNASTGAIQGATYKWTFTGNRTSTETNPELTFNTLAGEAELTITSAEGCTDVVKKSFDVDLIRLELQDVLSGCVGTSLKPTATNTNTKFAHTYSWTPLSIIESGANTATPTFKSNVAGDTKAILTITNSLGCTKKDSVSVSALAKAALNPSDITFKQDCQTRKIDFKNNNTTLANNYSWVFGDPTNPTAGSTQTAPSYTYAQSGEVTVTLIPTLTCYDTLKVKVPVNTPLSLTKGADKAVCDATAQSLTVTTNNPSNKVEWSTNRNFTTIAGTGATFNGPQIGAKTTYYVRVSDAAGTCTSAVDSIVITNNEIKATIAAPTSLGLCAGTDNKQITVNNPNNDGLKVTWTPVAVIKGSNTVLNPTINVASASIGTITGTFENQFGCKTTKTVPYTATSVNLNAGADQNVCSPAAQTLAAVSNGTKIEWSLNSNFAPVAGTGSTFNATPTNSVNIYYVRSSDANCVVVDTVTINNNELKVTVSTPTLALCVGTAKQATVNAPAGTTVVWTPANVIDGSNTVLNPQIKAGTVGTGKITGEFTNKGCKTTQEISYTATEVKAAVTASEKLVYKDFDVTLNATPTGTGFTYKWTPIPTATTAQIKTQPSAKTTYTVEVTDANGCKSTASVDVDVITPECAEPYVYVPTAFSPNNDGRNDKIRVHGEFLTSCEFVIFNRWGEKIFETKIFENGESEGWDGTHGNKGVCPDVYGFYVRGKCRDGVEFFKKGNITVLK